MSITKVSFKTLNNLLADKTRWVLYIAHVGINGACTASALWPTNNYNNPRLHRWNRPYHVYVLMPADKNKIQLGDTLFRASEIIVYTNG